MGFDPLLVGGWALTTTLGALAFTAAPALAAAPELPTLTVESHVPSPPSPSTEAVFRGVLNPLKQGGPATYEFGEYEFLYKEGATCTGGGKAPSSPAISIGGGEEAVAQTVTGLKAHSKYTVCLVARNGTEINPANEIVTAGVAFETAIPQETPGKAELVEALSTSLKVKGVLNPVKAGEAGSYEFLYKDVVNGAGCEGEGSLGGSSTGAKGELVEAEATGLQPHSEYTFCLRVHNDAGEMAQSSEVLVETLSPPPAIVSENAYSPGGQLVRTVSSLQGRLEATVNPENQVTECHFQYGKTMATVSENEVLCEQASIENGEQGVAVTVTGLEPAKTYHYRVVLKNVKGEEEKGTGTSTFETLAAPVLQTRAAEEVSGTSANLGGKLNAGGEARYYVEYGTGPCGASSCGVKTYELTAFGKVQECTLDNVLQECVTPIVVEDLQPLTTYHYWFVAINAAVTTPVHGAAMQFTTGLAPPTVQTGVAEAVTTTSAELTGTLEPGGEAQYYFEYGTEPCGSSTCGTATAGSALSGATQQAASPATVTGLQPNTTYYYRLVATNADVTSPIQGEARQFTTPKSGAQEAAEAAARNKPEAERAAAAAAQQRLEAEARQQGEAAAAANAAKHKQYEELTTLTAALERQEAEAAKKREAEEKAKSKPVKCKKGKKLSHGKCVKKKSKSKKAKKTSRATNKGRA